MSEFDSWNWSNSSISTIGATRATNTQSIYVRMIAVILQIYNVLAAYFLPLVILLATINNILCILVFTLSREFKTKTSRNARIYYIAFAAAGLCTQSTLDSTSGDLCTKDFSQQNIY